MSEDVDKMRANMRDKVWTYCAMLLEVSGDRPFEAGTATFVVADGRHCLLTAAHVWGKVSKNRKMLALSLESDRIVRTIALPLMQERAAHRGTDDALGPDIALIELAIPDVSAIKVSKAFYSLDKRTHLADLPHTAFETGGWAIIGAPAEQTTEAERELTARITLFQSNVNPPVERDGFDYVDLRLGERDRTVVPKSFGGLSGSGLWTFVEREVTQAGEEPWDPLLCGVAFYQGPGPDSKYIRCHGPKSVYSRIRTATTP